MSYKLIIAGLIIIIGGYFLVTQLNTPPVFNPLNATYTLNDRQTTLVNGYAEESVASGLTGKVITRVFGIPTIGDINGDGTLDAALLLSQEMGGSGTFYYAAAAIASSSGALGTNAIFLGDRIAPQNIEIRDGQIIANFADRKPGEPMTASPSLGVSAYINYVDGKLQEILND